MMMLALLAALTQPVTTNNHAGCDIAVAPAATLLLPYFEVDLTSATGTTTLFTVTNTSAFPQIAHVTLWTDLAFPVLNFNLFLTGYDVQAVNLYDVLVGGTIPITRAQDTNPNFVALHCADLPGHLPSDAVIAARRALSGGIGADCTLPVGISHVGRAIGYATIDVVSYCTTQFPADSGGRYFAGPAAAILFDNVLLGDTQQIDAGGFDAEGSPMVHIRAVPEGGLSGAGGGTPVAANLPFTFYDRYTPDGARTADRRQPLPSTFGVRFLQSSTLTTSLTVWREGVTAGRPTCTAGGNARSNSEMLHTRAIRFDEHDNSWDYGVGFCTLGCFEPLLPLLTRTVTSSSLFPPFGSFDQGGWMFLNLNSMAATRPLFSTVCHATLSAQRAGFGDGCATAAPGQSGSRSTTQNWVTASLFGTLGTKRLAVAFDAAWLGNGCTPALGGNAIVAPAPQKGGPLVCPPGAKCAAGTLPAELNP